jgi:hypothetical protein
VLVVVGTASGTLTTWPRAGKPWASAQGHAGVVRAIALVGADHIASIGADSLLRLWSRDLTPIATLPLPGTLLALAAWPDRADLVVVASFPPATWRWRLGSEPVPIDVGPPCTGALALPEGRLALCGDTQVAWLDAHGEVYARAHSEPSSHYESVSMALCASMGGDRLFARQSVTAEIAGWDDEWIFTPSSTTPTPVPDRDTWVPKHWIGGAFRGFRRPGQKVAFPCVSIGELHVAGVADLLGQGSVLAIHTDGSLREWGLETHDDAPAAAPLAMERWSLGVSQGLWVYGFDPVRGTRRSFRCAGERGMARRVGDRIVVGAADGSVTAHDDVGMPVWTAHTRSVVEFAGRPDGTRILVLVGDEGRATGAVSVDALTGSVGPELALPTGIYLDSAQVAADRWATSSTPCVRCVGDGPPTVVPNTSGLWAFRAHPSARWGLAIDFERRVSLVDLDLGSSNFTGVTTVLDLRVEFDGDSARLNTHDGRIATLRPGTDAVLAEGALPDGAQRHGYSAAHEAGPIGRHDRVYTVQWPLLRAVPASGGEAGPTCLSPWVNHVRGRVSPNGTHAFVCNPVEHALIEFATGQSRMLPPDLLHRHHRCPGPGGVLWLIGGDEAEPRAHRLTLDPAADRCFAVPAHTHVALCPNGSRLALATADHALGVFDSDGKELARCPLPDSVVELAFTAEDELALRTVLGAVCRFRIEG